MWEAEALYNSPEEQAKRLAKRDADMESSRQAEATAAKAREEEWRRQDEARFAREEEEREAMKRAQEKELEFISDNHRKQREAAEAAMKGEQAVLRAEQDRQKAFAHAKNNPKIEIDDSHKEYAYKFEAGMEKVIKTFRQRGTGGDALLVKIDHGKDELQLEENLHGTTVEALAERLEDCNEPRYVLFIHKLTHSDGRTTFPISFIVFMPENVPAHLKMMYTRPIPLMVDTFKVNKHFTIEDPEDLDLEWLEAKIAGKH